MTVSLLPKWLIFVKKALQFSKFDLTKLIGPCSRESAGKVSGRVAFMQNRNRDMNFRHGKE